MGEFSKYIQKGSEIGLLEANALKQNFSKYLIIGNGIAIGLILSLYKDVLQNKVPDLNFDCVLWGFTISLLFSALYMFFTAYMNYYAAKSQSYMLVILSYAKSRSAKKPDLDFTATNTGAAEQNGDVISDSQARDGFSVASRWWGFHQNLSTGAGIIAVVFFTGTLLFAINQITKLS